MPKTKRENNLNRKIRTKTAIGLDTHIDNYIEENTNLREKLCYTTDKDLLTSYEQAIWNMDLRPITFALKLYKLSSIAIDIILYLHLNGGFIVGGFSDLTRALGRTDGPKGQAPNISKVCHELEDKGILIIWLNEKNRPEQIDLADNWMKLL